eukprot:CAMPEP_0205801662 /NCGR_PEP_ID=MMETSP0205-20121125/3708_1 /ASSEMBLY_ACC=CAM_ASM_000278 /TAXON_ID=36767 /ORGANISM="Euplotes focardii, Strain TN1" /LENGTH=301 /DNA_ID=CAMNT_0053066749 /DNA_START=77 /DNA_END=978 /DNA_ORIENTATION=-
MAPYGGDSVEVKVKPGENKIILLNRQDRGCSFNSTYYTTLIKPIDNTLSVIKTKGKKHQIEYNGEEYEVFYYVYKDGNGYLWYFENISDKSDDQRSYTFDGTFYFKLENLEIDEVNEDNQENEKSAEEEFTEKSKSAEEDFTEKSKSEYKIKLKPGETSYVKLSMKDLTKSWGYKYSYSFKLKEEIRNNDKLIEKVRKDGKKKQISYKDEKVDVYYYIMFLNERYIWFYENMTEKKFKATFSFELMNLKIDNGTEKEEEDEDEENEWEILLQPNESCIKTITRVDPKKESKYRSSYSYRLT